MTTDSKKKSLLVTIALPYANGPLHLGHLLEAIQADIWVRFHKLQGIECYFISGSDAHGTSIMLSAEKYGTTPEAQIKEIHKEHQEDFESFLIHFDNFYTTHSPENEALSREIYLRLRENGDIITREISQAFDPKKQLFLADRFISGECPRCGATDQHGDSCEVCGATYTASELINPYSKLSGEKPIQKKSVHYFFQLSHYEHLLRAWLTSEHLQPHVIHKLQEWFESGLKDWDISRDAPYFGFEIPDAPGKYFYVWLDAPIGYMASFKNLCKRQEHLSFDQYWEKDSRAELYHFIGKDIIYFHSLFWPALLESAGYRLPTAIFAHGFLTVNGNKMSKSRGTFITAKQYAKNLPPEYLRYYVACKLTGQVEDIDLNFQDFMTRVNSDLVGKYVNLASRCAGFIKKQFNSQLADSLQDESLFHTFVAAGDTIAAHYQKLCYQKALHEIMQLADQANQYIDQHKPWQLAKEEKNASEVQAVCTQGVNLFRLLTLYLKPVLPKTAEKVEDFLNIPPLCWEDRHKALLKQKIKTFQPLLYRVTPEEIAAFNTQQHGSV